MKIFVTVPSIWTVHTCQGISLPHPAPRPDGSISSPPQQGSSIPQHRHGADAVAAEDLRQLFGIIRCTMPCSWPMTGSRMTGPSAWRWSWRPAQPAWRTGPGCVIIIGIGWPCQSPPQLVARVGTSLICTGQLVSWLSVSPPGAGGAGFLCISWRIAVPGQPVWACFFAAWAAFTAASS